MLINESSAMEAMNQTETNRYFNSFLLVIVVYKFVEQSFGPKLGGHEKKSCDPGFGNVVYIHDVMVVDVGLGK